MNNYLKIVLAVIMVGSVVLYRSEWIHDRCDYQVAQQAVKPILWFEQTMDGSAQHHLITRFLHNKAGVFLSQSARCYFQSLEPYLIYKITGIAGLFAFLYLIYKIIDHKKYVFLLIIAMIPFITFFKLPAIIQISAYKISALLGIYLLLKKHK